MNRRNIIGVLVTTLLILFVAQISVKTAHAVHVCDGQGLTGSALSSCRANPANIHTLPPGSTVPPGSTGINNSVSIANPLQSTTILEFLARIIDILLIFALPIIVFFIIFAGFKFVTAHGNESEITVAKTALTWAVVGGVIILGARLIITVIQGTISAL